MKLQSADAGTNPTLKTIRPDVIAGLTAAAVVLPKAMAYATVAGLPVAVGLYTAFLPMVIYALLGTSRVLSVSSTTTLAILAGVQLSQVVPDGDPAKLVTAGATLTALVGVMLLLAALLRLGFVANFISSPVLTGFKAGIGIVIVLDQVPKLLGVHIAKQGFFHDLLNVAYQVPHSSLVTLAVAVTTLVVLIGMEYLWPHSPAPLVAVGGGIAASWFFGLHAQGVATVGLIPQGFPSLTLPDLKLVEQLIPGALGIALMSFTESIAAGRAFASPGEPPINANRELMGLALRRHAGWRRHVADCGRACRRWAVTESIPDHRRRCGCHHVAACSLARPAAACHPGSGRDRLFSRVDPANGIPRYLQGAGDGISLGGRRLPRGIGIRHSERYRGGDYHFAHWPVQPGCTSPRLRHRP